MSELRHRSAPALVIMLLLLAFGTVAHAQEAPALRVALVSLQKIEANFTALRTQEDTLGQWLQSQRSLHDELANYVFLSSADFAEVAEILKKPRPLSDEDQARLAELRAISDQKDARYVELRAKTDRTPAENDEFNSLQDILEARQADLARVRESIMSELDDRRKTALAGLMTRVDEAIKAEAEAGGYDLVLDATMVFLGGIDITDAVIARLNAEAGEAGAAAEGEAGETETGEAAGGGEGGGQGGQE